MSEASFVMLMAILAVLYAVCHAEPASWWGLALFKDGDPMDDATAIDEAASALTSPQCRVESFLRMKDSAGDVGVDIGVAVVGVVERGFPRK